MPAPCPFCGHVGHVEDRTISDLGMHSVHRCARCDREFMSAPELPDAPRPLRLSHVPRRECPACKGEIVWSVEGESWISTISHSRTEVIETITCPHCGASYEVGTLKECPFTAGACDGNGCMAWHPVKGCLLIFGVSGDIDRPTRAEISALGNEILILKAKIAALESGDLRAFAEDREVA